MKEILENISLKPFNTFGIDAQTRYLIKVNSIEEINEIYTSKKFQSLKKLIIGGGSNILLQSDFDGLVIKNEIKGIRKIKEDENHVWIEVGAGENWHEFVLHCIEKNWAGIENLSLIPGCVGAAPMQNIGAYGVEVKDVIDTVETIQISNLEKCIFSNEDCHFGYRESVFKNEEKNKHCIVNVVFKLNKNPNFKISYGAIEEELKKEPETPISIKKISDAVIRIRQSKLPDPKQIGNAGSFFKNPEISNEIALKIKVKHPNLVSYSIDDKTVKLAAGWLIENTGWKGYTENNFGVHKLQALVLVNYGGAKGCEILELSTKIIQSVHQKFGVVLEREVNII
jgi:UDP-N-acetylmuramate dehydrogenase